jgi:hypothetical protein
MFQRSIPGNSALRAALAANVAILPLAKAAGGQYDVVAASSYSSDIVRLY